MTEQAKRCAVDIVERFLASGDPVFEAARDPSGRVNIGRLAIAGVAVQRRVFDRLITHQTPSREDLRVWFRDAL